MSSHTSSPQLISRLVPVLVRPTADAVAIPPNDERERGDLVFAAHLFHSLRYATGQAGWSGEVEQAEIFCRLPANRNSAPDRYSISDRLLLREGDLLHLQLGFAAGFAHNGPFSLQAHRCRSGEQPTKTQRAIFDAQLGAFGHDLRNIPTTEGFYKGRSFGDVIACIVTPAARVQAVSEELLPNHRPVVVASADAFTS